MIEKNQKFKKEFEPQSKGINKNYCLCWKNCKHFIPENEKENCPIAQSLLKFDKKYGVTTPVWKCETYEE